ncbi:PBP1A family penicillin-binding protein [Sphingomonas parva]|uniref:PBP1A family penicillin-binding protein n=1 Tax=Sphingomonas parva TaxID=2555898 RepID=A0A4Y8ZXV1_9SPHN|nr:PBP1A family penicillin-binding protein [Sphingomonas parva]TFI59699.1 PBP1A family penicillin-binding protein [Sphingomonas parva]
MRIDSPGTWQDLPADQMEFGPGPGGGEAPRQKPWWRRWRWRHLVLACISLFMLLVAWLAITAPLSKSLQPIAAPSLTLLSAEGEPIARRGADIRDPVRIADLPAHVPNAFIAIEDKRFHDHLGISVRGIARAAWRNLGAGGVREGGSTITQQLAKISFLSSERTAGRKAQEVLIAFWLEAWLTKDEILERYLSNVYFGDNVYGLRAAAHHYFSVPPEKLTVAQAAMLAGMVKAPSRLAPTRNYNLARQRGRVVIAAMIEQNMLTPAQRKALKPARLKVEPQREVPTGTYFADWVLPAARARGDAEEGYGAQEVQTTLEARLQKMALASIRRAGLGRAQVALVAMRPDGRVVAMVGGKDYARSPFNRATQARRQPGSTFKLFVWLAALRAGMDPDDVIEDTPLRIGDWQPKNYGNRYRGRLTLREALAVSSNVGAVRIAQRVGMDNVIRAARDLGVTSPLDPNPSLALGTSGVSLLEMTRAYAAVAAGAYPVRARGLAEEEKPWWQRMWQRSVAGAASDSNFDEMKEMLAGVVQQGTGRGAALQVPVYGKTGTSQDNRDALFIGFTDDLVVGVWVGNDDNSPLGNVAGGGLPARIWRDFTAQAIGSRPAQPTAPPIAAPAEEVADGDAIEGNVSLPIEGTGYEVGVGLDGNGFTVSVAPGAEPGVSVQDGGPQPAPEDAPVIDAPPAAPPPRLDRPRAAPSGETPQGEQ